MKTYELTYIVSPSIALEQAQLESKKLEDKIQEKGGVILKSEKPVAKTLSYQIKKSGSGFFSVLEFQAEPETIKDILDKLTENKNLLRHILLVKNPAKKFKERRQRIKPIAEALIEEVKEDTNKVVDFIKEEIIKPVEDKIESIIEPKEEKKTTTKKVRSEKNKEKAEIEDIDKKLEEILSE